jgi:DNA helicase-2/ATP-dependent DNA helicase PcrA
LDLHSLRLLERGHSFTLLGDLAQSIYGHRGLTAWAQVEAIFREIPHRYEECGISYRTTAEITALANRVLRSIGALSETGSGVAEVRRGTRSDGPREAQAFERHGGEPVLTPVADERHLVQAVARSLADLGASGYATIAVIVKTAERARDLADRLAEAQLPNLAVASQPDFDYRGGVVVLPVWLAKGLEFDASVVVDVDAQTYGRTAFDGRLLYVALTRAMHALNVLWTGELSPHLQTN